VFSEIEGMTGLNKTVAKPIKIKGKQQYRFTLDKEMGSDKPFDGRSLAKYKCNGKVTGIKTTY
jgi:hypothetical protein